MEKYSRKTLGADMVGYFQVLNGCKTMQVGDTMKVPKVELRPEYRIGKVSLFLYKIITTLRRCDYVEKVLKICFKDFFNII